MGKAFLFGVDEKSGGAKPEQEKSVTYTENGEYEVTPDEGKTLSLVSVSVDVPAPTPNLQSKTVTENGTVTPDTGYDGLSQVVVNVPSAPAPQLFPPVFRRKRFMSQYVPTTEEPVRIESEGSGYFPESYSIYYYNGTLLANVPTVNGGFQFMNADAWNLPVGYIRIKAKSNASNFVSSDFSDVGDYNCYAIIENFTHITATQNRTKYCNEDFSIHIVADEGYTLPKSITVRNGNQGDYTVDSGDEWVKLYWSTGDGFVCRYRTDSSHSGVIEFYYGYHAGALTITAEAEEAVAVYHGTIDSWGTFGIGYAKIYDSAGNLTWEGHPSETVEVPIGGYLDVSAEESYGGVWVKVYNLVNCTSSVAVNEWAETIRITPTADNFSFTGTDDFD